ncbi:hypothetical protein BDN67DRAFT_1018004 [Paxillus ammoniavirescens]|nr:hypothetical protein BDN67DRAFT_1018004 [Paxillus ammoniavirescens]
MGNCTATPSVIIIGYRIVSSYLILFLKFFHKTYTENAGLIKNVATIGSSMHSHLKPRDERRSHSLRSVA